MNRYEWNDSDIKIIKSEDIQKINKQEETMPKPNPGESEKDFVARCIPIVMDEGSTQEQAAGKCYGIYRNSNIQKAKRKTIRGYLSPEPGDLSDKENDILAETYASAREKGYDKERSAKIAWGAVNNYKKRGMKKTLLEKTRQLYKSLMRRFNG